MESTRLQQIKINAAFLTTDVRNKIYKLAHVLDCD